MRLLNVESLELAVFHRDKKRPKYAIASHRWINDSEVTFKDFQKRRNTDSIGYKKIQNFAKYIREHVASVEWLWIDTCCIDQKSSPELSEAINSMFRWYRDAEVCLAYLQDVPTAEDISSFEKSAWFKRGWTLQELLAPSVVVFLAQDWQVIGHKGRSGGGRSGVSIQTGALLDSRIAAITHISETILQDYNKSHNLSIEEKLQWTRHRQTTHEEDLSYCLLGILGVSMNIRYGDGHEMTRARLLKKARLRADTASAKSGRDIDSVQTVQLQPDVSFALDRPDGVILGNAGLISLAIDLAENGRKIRRLCNSFGEAPTFLEEVANELETFGHALYYLERDRQSHSHNPVDDTMLQRCIWISDRAGDRIRSAVDGLETTIQKSKASGQASSAFNQPEILRLSGELDRAKTSLALAYQLYTESHRKTDVSLILRMLADNNFGLLQESAQLSAWRHDLQHIKSNRSVQHKAHFLRQIRGAA